MIRRRLYVTNQLITPDARLPSPPDRAVNQSGHLRLPVSCPSAMYTRYELSIEINVHSGDREQYMVAMQLSMGLQEPWQSLTNK